MGHFPNHDHLVCVRSHASQVETIPDNLCEPLLVSLALVLSRSSDDVAEYLLIV